MRKKLIIMLLQNNINFEMVSMFNNDMLTMNNYSKYNLFKNMFKIKEVNT